MAITDQFGCELCFQASAEAAAQARRTFRELSRPVDESHCVVRILACPHCGQRCVSVFTEWIDWSGGDDAQYWSTLPLTEEESASLMARDENSLFRMIEAIGKDRRYLMVDFPTGQPKRALWADGNLLIGPHD